MTRQDAFVQMQVLLLDELTTFLDKEDAANVLRVVKEVVAEARGVAAVWVTHRFDELQHADDVTYMDSGQVQRSGSPGQILRYLRSLGAAT